MLAGASPGCLSRSPFLIETVFFTWVSVRENKVAGLGEQDVRFKKNAKLLVLEKWFSKCGLQGAAETAGDLREM